VIDDVGALAVGEDVIELEVSVLDELGYAVHSELTLMHHHLRVGGRDTVDLASLDVLFLK
jgi:hypothetical protein